MLYSNDMLDIYIKYLYSNKGWIGNGAIYHSITERKKMFFQTLTAATVAALISSTNVWADHFPREKFDLDEDHHPDLLTFADDGVAYSTNEGSLIKADGRISLEVVDVGILRIHYPKENGVRFATTGGVIDNAAYLHGEGEVDMRGSIAQINAGAWESREALKDASRDNTNYGVAIHTLANSKVKGGMTVVYSDLETALQVTEALAESQDWQVAVLTAKGGGVASATYYTTAFVYGIAVWGDRVIYKAWESADKYNENWGIYPLTEDGKNTVLVLDKILINN